MRVRRRKLFYCLPALAAAAALMTTGASAPRAGQRRTPPSPCPKVTTSCPDTGAEGASLTFTANVEGGDQNVTPTFNWTVSAGTISSGQGTSTITVDTTEVGNQTATATVDVGGYDRNCSTSASCSSSVMKKAGARKIDEYGSLRPGDENPRLDNFAIELQNDPTAQAYVIAYGGRTSAVGAAQRAADRSKGYLTSRRGIDAGRVVTVDGGFREQPEVELWIAPTGATPPAASPTVNPRDVKPAKPTPAPAKKPATRRRKP